MLVSFWYKWNCFSWGKLISRILFFILYIQKFINFVIFANSLDPDQAQQNVGPDLDPNCLTL